MIPDHKICQRCQQDLPASNFYISKRGGKRLYLSTYCRTCHQIVNKLDNQIWHSNNHERDAEKARERTRKWYRNHPEANQAKGWKDHLWQRFGITPEQYDSLVRKQEGKCAVCGKIPGGSGRSRRLIVDHDHKRGKVRGLLCYSCNNMIGYLETYPELLPLIEDYLKKDQFLLELANA